MLSAEIGSGRLGARSALHIDSPPQPLILLPVLYHLASLRILQEYFARDAHLILLSGSALQIDSPPQPLILFLVLYHLASLMLSSSFLPGLLFWYSYQALLTYCLDHWYSYPLILLPVFVQSSYKILCQRWSSDTLTLTKYSACNSARYIGSAVTTHPMLSSLQILHTDMFVIFKETSVSASFSDANLNSATKNSKYFCLYLYQNNIFLLDLFIWPWAKENIMFLLWWAVTWWDSFQDTYHQAAKLGLKSW